MTNNSDEIVALKNNWLYQQVDVEYPTRESLSGRTIYQHQQANAQYLSWQAHSLSQSLAHDIYLVDFHRLTIMFALLQATRFDEEEKSDIVEFLTQIIYSPPCELYLGFEQGIAVAAGIVTRHKNQVLFSDIVVQPDSQFVSEEEFSAQLAEKLSLNNDDIHIVIEK